MTTNTSPIADMLTDLLANSFRLMFKTQSAHWNATGPLFASLHALTERQYTETFAAIDVLAERIRALGEYAPSSLDELMARANVRDRFDIPPTQEMIHDLAQDHTLLAEHAEALAQYAAQHQDSATADLATNRRAVHEKEAWLLRAML